MRGSTSAGLFVLVVLFFASATKPVHSQTIVQNLDNMETAVAEICTEVQRRWKINSNDIEGYPDGCNSLEGCNVDTNQPGWGCNGLYGKGSTCGCSALNVNLNLAVTLTAQAVDEESLPVKETQCRVDKIGQNLQTIANQYGLIGLFSGYQTGVHVSYPARDWRTATNSAGCRTPVSQCPDFDPRFRSWYVAATSGPKNVILVIDVSGSMEDYDRISLAKDAAITVLNTLTFADWVGVVQFSTFASSASFKLQQATNTTVNQLINYVNLLYSGGNTNYEAGFEKAFALLQDSVASNQSTTCQSAILFLTDGAITEGLAGEEFLSMVQQRNENLNAKIFTYGLGSAVDSSVLQPLACQHEGIYTAIPDQGDLRSKMGSYYQYYASGVQSRRVVWDEPDVDCCGLGVVTTAALACYDDQTSPPTLLGVVGSSIPVSYLDGNSTDNTLLSQLLSRSLVCPDFQLTEEQIESLRGDTRCKPSPVALGVGIGVGLGVPVAITVACIVGCVVNKRRRMARIHRADQRAEGLAAAREMAIVAPRAAEAAPAPQSPGRKKKYSSSEEETKDSSSSSSSSQSDKSSESPASSEESDRSRSRHRKGGAAATADAPSVAKGKTSSADVKVDSPSLKRSGGRKQRQSADPSQPKKIRSKRKITPKTTDDVDEDKNVCKICFDKAVAVAMIPCGHRFACKDCAPAMKGKQCAICRTKVNDLLVIFDS